MHKNFNSSRLVRLLGTAARVEVDAPKADFAERLSQWVDAFDAIRLHAAHQQTGAPGLPGAQQTPAELAAGLATTCVALEAQFRRVRAALMQSITAHEDPGAQGQSATQLPPAVAPTPVTAADFARFRLHCVDQQRLMEAKIAALRAQVRQALAQASAPLGQLAALDAVLEQTLGGREQQMLSTVPALLKRRFEQLRASAPAEAGLAPDGWLDGFARELRDTLLAELDVRLQPVVGLLEALSKARGTAH